MSCSIIQHTTHDNMIHALHTKITIAVTDLLIMGWQFVRRTRYKTFLDAIRLSCMT